MAHDIQERAYRFAVQVVELHEQIRRKSGAARAMATQLLKSGTSIGANLEEASAAQSKADFICKCSIASKEARETRYWLRLLCTCNGVNAETLAPWIEEAGEIVAVITTIVKNAPLNSTFTIQH